MAISTESLKNYIVRSLGGSTVHVELTDDDLEIAIDESLTFYSRLNPIRDRESKKIQPGGISSFDLPPTCYNVIDVEIQSPSLVMESADPTTFNIFNNFFLMGSGTSSQGVTGTENYALYNIWRSMTMKEFSLDPDYYIEEDVQYTEDHPDILENRKIHFYNPTGLTLRVFYVPVHSRRLDQISDRDVDWVRKYAVAHAKEMLGYKRRKHKAIPMAGQTLQLDGAELVQEAMEAKAKLEDDLKFRIPLPPPVYG